MMLPGVVQRSRRSASSFCSRWLQSKHEPALVLSAVLALIIFVTWLLTSGRIPSVANQEVQHLEGALHEHALGLDRLVQTLDTLNALSDTLRGTSDLDPTSGAWQVLPAEGVAWRPLPHPAEHTAQHRHKMAVLLPFRDRTEHLHSCLPKLASYLQAQGRAFDLFVVEQSQKFRFNRGALLNAGVLLLEGSDYDYFVFHDVDTVPIDKPAGNVQYEYPAGAAPLHLTSPGYHPHVRYEDFFGGVTAFTREQIYAVNGFATSFWGWGREDDNMRERLKRAGRWPPQTPPPPTHSRTYYFRHLRHRKAPEVRVRRSADGVKEYYEDGPDRPYNDSLIVSSQPDVFNDFTTGLNTTTFWVNSVQPYFGLAVKYEVELSCSIDSTPWCQ